MTIIFHHQLDTQEKLQKLRQAPGLRNLQIENCISGVLAVSAAFRVRKNVAIQFISSYEQVTRKHGFEPVGYTQVGRLRTQ